jgi:hypothetical protein
VPVFEITAPDGRTFEVNAPEGATKEDALAYAKSHFAAHSQQKANLLDTFDQIDKQQPAQQVRERGALQSANYLGEQSKSGIATGLGAPVDIANNLVNLGIAGYGVAKHALTGSADLPALNVDPFGGSASVNRGLDTLLGYLGFKPGAEPTGPINRAAGRFVRDLSAAAVPIAAIAGRPAAFLPRNPSVPALIQAQAQSPVPALLAGTGTQLAASTGGELARAAAPQPYKDAADMAGQMVGGIALPAMLLSRIQAVNSLVDAAKPENANRMATGFVENKIRNDVRNYPGAADRLNQALELQSQIPGFNPRIGQAAGVPSLIDMERRVATSSPEAFNKRAIQDEANRAAIQRQAEQDLPLLTKNDVADKLQMAQSERQDLAASLPEVAAEETGQTLRAGRSALKGRYDQIAAQKFGEPAQEAQRLGVKVNPAPIVEKVQELLQNPALQYDANNLPAIAQRIKSVVGREEPGANVILGANGEPAYAARDRVFNIDFGDLAAMRSEVGKDIARELTSATPNARQRLRSLYDIQNAIDEVAQTAPKSVTDKWNAAREWFRTEYVPRFRRGINLKQSLRDITGEQRISDERLPGQYFKKMSPTPMNRFVKLYGDSPQARNAMENHILDTYRREVVKDGVIDPARHDAFLRNYGPALKQLPSMSEKLDSMGNAARLLSAREEALTQAKAILDKGQLERLKYEDHGTLGLDPRKLDAYLAQHREDFREKVAATEGAKVADEHLKNLEKFAKAAAIADRGRLSPNAYPEQSTNPMELKNKLGFTGRTVFSMWRAVTTGRTSAEDVAYTLGMQGASHRVRMALIAAEEKAISDPETAKLIAQSINQPANSETGKAILQKLLEKGGLFVVNSATGRKNYERMGRYAIPPFAIQSTEKGREAAQ